MLGIYSNDHHQSLWPPSSLNLIITASMPRNYFVKIPFSLSSSNCIHLLYPFDWLEIRMQSINKGWYIPFYLPVHLVPFACLFIHPIAWLNEEMEWSIFVSASLYTIPVQPAGQSMDVILYLNILQIDSLRPCECFTYRSKRVESCLTCILMITTKVYDHLQLFGLPVWLPSSLNLIKAASMPRNYFVKIPFSLSSSNCIHLL